MFKTDLDIRRIIGVNNCWQTLSPLVFEYYQDKKKKVYTSPSVPNLKACIITVKKGFIFDFASVPKALTNLFPKSGARYDRASCLHDWLYATKMTSRAEADEIFLKAMISDKVGKIRAYSMYYAVRAFGFIAWGDKKRETFTPERGEL
ncbi:DUF1353 domain-containing protein [Campylobacter sp. 19-13652]|uniref:DUF1353 domain-containing protein n=1 Tax=Campylobacter sp. 19-13652 TaxID=2840180 RepID=UPI001C775438|nr:DUF1353 domain-containing protein [Campylobacter sp. 19-13652]BCX79291.1 hypothetical protein LBC_07530 [Campylobacter sp. 19-13652]